jgi:tripartite-type tricarboxylate transporter receptor subunit TctC
MGGSARRVLGVLLMAVGLAALAPPAAAQAYPARPVRIVVPFPAGSAGDIAARVVAAELQGSLGGSFIVDNRPGAQGTVGTEHAARSPADGYTLLLAAISFAAAPSEFRKLNYDPVKDFEPLAMIGTLPLALMVKPDFPARDVPGFLAHARARSTPLTGGYGSSSSRVSIAQLRALAGVRIDEVSYKGIPPAITDVIAGATDLTFADLGNALAQVKAGTLRALAVTSARRSTLAPDIPAMAETVPGYDLYAWIALVVPTGTPKDIADLLHAEIAKGLTRAKPQATLAVSGFSPAPMGREELGRFIASEVVRWGQLNRAAGIEPQ